MLNQDNDFALHEARRSFGAFYCAATPDDELWMDALVLAWIGFVKNTTIPREGLPNALRDHVERTGDKVELLFMRARDRVCGSETYKKMMTNDQQRIATMLFDTHWRPSCEG